MLRYSLSLSRSLAAVACPFLFFHFLFALSKCQAQIADDRMPGKVQVKGRSRVISCKENEWTIKKKERRERGESEIVRKAVEIRPCVFLLCVGSVDVGWRM